MHQKVVSECENFPYTKSNISSAVCDMFVHTCSDSDNKFEIMGYKHSTVWNILIGAIMHFIIFCGQKFTIEIKLNFTECLPMHPATKCMVTVCHMEKAYPITYI